MALQHAYAITNKAPGAAGFTWSVATTSSHRLIDGRLDDQIEVTGTLTTVNVVIDFGVATTLNAIALLNHNLATATGAQVKVEAADNAAINIGNSTPKALTTLYTTAPREKDHVLQFAALSKRFWRITFSWTGTFTLRIGELFAAETTVLTRAMVYGNVESVDFVRSRFTGSTGETRGHFIAGPIRARDISFEDLDVTERNEMMAMFLATKGGTRPMLWCEQYEATATAADSDHQECLFGKLEDPSFGLTNFDYGRFNPSGMRLKSLGREVGA